MADHLGPAPAERLAGDRYVLLEELATGGMGAVWRALDRSTGKQLALKRLQLEGKHADLVLHAFRREYQVLKGITHPRIIRAFDYGVDEVGPYYTMELLGGQDLRESAPVPWRTACAYLRDVATSLALLHARGFVHRDLSPANVRITPDERCKLLDFGALAPFGVSRLIVGTAPFVPPEAARHEALDQRSDLYSLGALAYWTITGRHAYPAKNMAELPKRWQSVPPALSTLAPDVPPGLDALVMSLLSADPLARPGSAAEVITMLSSIAELPPERSEDASALLQSFLTNPRFVGRCTELQAIDQALATLPLQRTGRALRIEAGSGTGRTRLLEEGGLRAQLAGAACVRVDASVHAHGSAVENLVLRVVEATPVAARTAAEPYRTALSELGPEAEARIFQHAPAGRSTPQPRVELGKVDAAAIVEWVSAVSREQPLVMLVDNVERADAAMLALLSALARRASQLPLLLLVAERTSPDEASLGIVTLRGACETLEMQGLSARETLELTRSLFGEAVNAERFAGWLHDQTTGSPLYFLELVRQLIARDLIRYADGMWVLPQARPAASLPGGLEEALAERMQNLSEDARALGGRLALHRMELDLALCRLLLPERDDGTVRLALDELARQGVLHRLEDGYAFTSTAVRDALIHSGSEYERLDNHRGVGAALVKLARETDYRLRMEAGWHLIQGGRESDGADLIMRITCDSLTMRHLVANLYHVGATVEAALEVYVRQRRSAYERMPLLAALAHAGFYENPVWGERYGDQALDVLHDVCGLRTASRLRRFCGGFLALVLGLLSGYFRYLLTRRSERPYSFKEVLTQTLSATTTLTGIFAMALDADRAKQVARVLEPFSVLPERTTPVGIYQFCVGLQQIARERQTTATHTFETLLARFRDPRYYPSLPDDARLLNLTGLLFALGAFSVFRANSKAALEVADELDASGLKLYAMVASQLRYLYHANRGELEEARKHRELVELHAVQVGSASQVERWEAPALLPLCIALNDVVGVTRAVHRMQMDTRTSQLLRPYRRLAEASATLIVDPGNVLHVQGYLLRELTSREPRSFIGWATTTAAVARGLLYHGDAASAEAWCLEALKHITDEDREYVTLFLDLDIQLALARGELGKTQEALDGLDALITRFTPSEHPLALGLLHEARARIAFAAGRREEYVQHTQLAESWLRPTKTPQLIAKCERLWELGRQSTGRSAPPDQDDPSSYAATSVGSGRNGTEVVEVSMQRVRDSSLPPA